jgi:hypothetical protein
MTTEIERKEISSKMLSDVTTTMLEYVKSVQRENSSQELANSSVFVRNVVLSPVKSRWINNAYEFTLTLFASAFIKNLKIIGLSPKDFEYISITYGGQEIYKFSIQIYDMMAYRYKYEQSITCELTNILQTMMPNELVYLCTSYCENVIYFPFEYFPNSTFFHEFKVIVKPITESVNFHAVKLSFDYYFHDIFQTPGSCYEQVIEQVQHVKLANFLDDLDLYRHINTICIDGIPEHLRNEEIQFVLKMLTVHWILKLKLTKKIGPMNVYEFDYVNFSKIEKMSFEFCNQDIDTNFPINIYAFSLNIFRVMKLLGGLAYG